MRRLTKNAPWTLAFTQTTHSAAARLFHHRISLAVSYPRSTDGIRNAARFLQHASPRIPLLQELTRLILTRRCLHLTALDDGSGFHKTKIPG
jgi:hypothetical protein